MLPADEVDLAASLLDGFAALSADVAGFTRPAYSAVETACMGLVAAAGREYGLEPRIDAVGNVWLAPAALGDAVAPADAVTFSLDIRSSQRETLASMERTLRQDCTDIGRRRGVTLDLGPTVGTDPVALDRTALAALAQDLMPACAVCLGATIVTVSTGGNGGTRPASSSPGSRGPRGARTK